MRCGGGRDIEDMVCVRSACIICGGTEEEVMV